MIPPLPTAVADTYLDRASWLAARRAGLGSSDAAAVLGLSPWHSPFSLFHEKIGLAPRPPAALEAAFWGSALEPLLAIRYAAGSGREVLSPDPFTIYRHLGRPWQLASLDRLTTDPDRGLGILELKTAAATKARDWDDGPPLAYQIQVQHQLATTGLAWASIAVLIGGNRFTWIDVDPHPGFIDALNAAEATFWDRINTLDPPAPDDTDATRATLATLYPTHDPDTVVQLPPDALQWDADRQHADEQIDHWTRVKTDAENHIKNALGRAEIGLLDDAVRYTWKSSPRKGYSVAPTTVRSLRRSVKP